MQKIRIFANVKQISQEKSKELPLWDGSFIKTGRIPCVGEYIVGISDYPSLEVTRVVHYVSSADGAVAGITLDVERI